MSEIVPNDRQESTDLVASRASGVSRTVLSSPGALASIALGAAALGLALAPQYRRRYTFAQLLPADVTDPAQVEQAFSTSVAALNERAAERNNQR